MQMTDMLLTEWDQEMASTRRTLERIPEDKLSWKPHPRSMTLGELASHLGNLLTWVNITLQTDEFDMQPEGAPPAALPLAQSKHEALESFDRNLAAARPVVEAATDEQLAAPWTLLATGEKKLTMDRLAVLRMFVLNHAIHHRAQLCMYLRLNDVPVPAIYGRSADENPM